MNPNDLSLLQFLLNHLPDSTILSSPTEDEMHQLPIDSEHTAADLYDMPNSEIFTLAVPGTNLERIEVLIQDYYRSTGHKVTLHKRVGYLNHVSFVIEIDHGKFPVVVYLLSGDRLLVDASRIKEH